MTSRDPAAGGRLARQQAARRRRRAGARRLAGGGAALVVAATAVVVLSGGDADTRPNLAAPPRPTTSTSAAVSPDAGPFGIATLATTEAPVYAQPAAEGEPITTLGPTTDYGLATTLAIDAATGPVPDGWVPVVVPLLKPNGMTGWVQTTAVTQSQTSYLIRVSLSEHRLVLLNAGQEVLATTVIIGTPETPTPLGRFYVTDPVNCNAAQVPAYPVAQCSRAYGEFAIGLSGLSEALDSFAGTVPQIAIHGTFLPDTELGKDLSNGCVRIPNTTVLQLAQTVPLGTPVEIVA